MYHFFVTSQSSQGTENHEQKMMQSTNPSAVEGSDIIHVISSNLHKM